MNVLLDTSVIVDLLRAPSPSIGVLREDSTNRREAIQGWHSQTLSSQQPHKILGSSWPPATSSISQCSRACEGLTRDPDAAQELLYIAAGSYGRASRTILKGVSAARRKRVNPASVAIARSLFSPAAAPNGLPVPCDSALGTQMKVEAE